MKVVVKLTNAKYNFNVQFCVLEINVRTYLCIRVNFIHFNSLP